MYVYRKANWFAMLWAGGVALALVYLPAILLPVIAPSRTTYQLTPSGRVTRYTEGTVGVLDGEGPAAYVSALLPLMLSIVPLLVSRRERWRQAASVVAAGLVGLYVLLGLWSIGLLYVPTVIALALAASGRMDAEQLPAPA